MVDLVAGAGGGKISSVSLFMLSIAPDNSEDRELSTSDIKLKEFEHKEKFTKVQIVRSSPKYVCIIKVYSIKVSKSYEKIAYHQLSMKRILIFFEVSIFIQPQ